MSFITFKRRDSARFGNKLLDLFSPSPPLARLIYRPQSGHLLNESSRSRAKNGTWGVVRSPPRRIESHNIDLLEGWLLLGRWWFWSAAVSQVALLPHLGGRSRR
jgi:hypothetical protein